MKRSFVLLFIVYALSVSALAQVATPANGPVTGYLTSSSTPVFSAPVAEVYGGFQYESVDFGGLIARQNFLGWDTSASVKVYRSLSAEGNFGGDYKTVEGVNLHGYYIWADLA